MADLDRDKRYYARVLLAYAALSILYQTCISQELTASIFHLAHIYRIVFGFVHFFYALGMLTAARLFRNRINPRQLEIFGVLTGLSVMASLLLALRVNSGADLIWLQTPAIVLVIGATLTLFGAMYAAIIIYLSQEDLNRVGLVISYSIAGLILGSLLRDLAVVNSGLNVTLLCIGIASAALTHRRKSVLLSWAALTALALTFPGLDDRIEAWRSAAVPERFPSTGHVKPFELPHLQRLFGGWSPTSRVDIFSNPHNGNTVGTINYRPEWTIKPFPDPPRQLAYSFVRPDDKVLCIAVGGGQPLLSLPLADPNRTIAVEMNALIVNFFRSNPKSNFHVFEKSRVITAEARYMLDGLGEPADIVIVDHPGSVSLSEKDFIGLHDLLYTTESIERIMEIVGKGMLVFNVRPVDAISVRASLDRLNIPSRTLIIKKLFTRERPDNLFIYSSWNRHKLDGIVGEILAAACESQLAAVDISARFDSSEAAPTDDQPNAGYRDRIRDSPRRIKSAGTSQNGYPSSYFREQALSQIPRLREICLAGLGILVFLIATAVISGSSGQESLKLGYFALIGCGLSLFQFAAYAKFRSFFGNTQATTFAATIIMLSGSAAGSLFTDRLGRLKPLHYLGLAGITAYTLFALESIPFGLSGTFQKWLAAGAILMPFSALSGMFYPFGISRLRPRRLGMALALDALGTVAGFIGFHLIAWEFGISRNYIPISACYLGACLLIPLGQSLSARRE